MARRAIRRYADNTSCPTCGFPITITRDLAHGGYVRDADMFRDHAGAGLL
jgi:hypothetical protein